MNTTVNTHNNQYLFWSPRILGLIMVLFLSILSLDVFGEYTGWELIIALIMHLIPSIIMAIALIIGWKNELYGTMIFNILALGSIFLLTFNDDLMPLIIFTLPLLLIAELFFYSWYREKSDFRDH